jgi:type I restriction enzyme S subunit
MEQRHKTELGELPVTWRVGPLGEFLSMAQYGASVKGAVSGACPILRMTNQVNGRISPSNVQYANVSPRELETFRVRRGDILFNRTNSFELVGRTSIFDLDGDYVFASYLIRLRTLPTALDPFFLGAYLNAPDTQRRLKTIATRAVSQSNISATRLRGFVIPVPPLAEQRKIAAVLGLVQRAIALQERLIALTAELKKALVQQLFTRGLRGESQKQTEVGRVPGSWEHRPLEAGGDIVYGIQAAVASNLKPIGTKILTNKNITLDGRIALESINYFVPKTPRHHAAVLRKGDLLFNWRSGSKEHVGKTAYFDLDGEFTHSSFILRIRPRDEVCGRYLFYYLNYLRESGYFVKSQTFGVNAKFNKSAVKGLPTYLPEKGERQEIVTALDAVSLRLKTLEAKHAALTDLFRTLLRQFMTAQIRVQDLEVPERESLSL